MKLKELKCINCGSVLNVKDSDKIVKCKYCKSEFSIEDSFDDGYNYQKGVLKAQKEHIEEQFNRFKGPINKIRKIYIIFFVFFFVLPFVFIFVNIGTHMIKGSSIQNSFEKSSFNNEFESIIGKQPGSFIINELNSVVKINTEKKHIIKLTYNDISSSDIDDIKNIISSIKNSYYYFIRLEYKKGYVSEIIIEDMK